jgi:glutathione peroxidase
MKTGKYLFILAASLVATHSFAGQKCPEVLDHEMRKLGSSERVKLCEAYAGKVLLVVNTASKCGFTPQFEGLEKLYQEKKNAGLVVLGFPSNDFRQELGNEGEIQNFCRVNYGVNFPMFSKIKVRGDEAHPLYKSLAQQADAAPRWNFYKYLIDRDGRVVESFSSFTSPDSDSLREAIERVL